MRNLWLLLCLALSVLGCKDKTPEATAMPTDETAVTTPDTVSAMYYHLIGTIGDLPVHMDILLRHTTFQDQQLVLGSYYYDKYSIPIPLYGYLTADSLVLSEEALNNDAEPPNMLGTIVGDSVYVGEWTHPLRQVKMPLRLSIVPNEGEVTFATRSVIDSIAGLPGATHSPKAYFDAQWLEPITDNEQLRTLLTDMIRDGMLEDSTVNDKTSIAAAVREHKQAFFADYQLIVQEGLVEGWLDTTEAQPSFSYAESITVRPYFSNAELLTLGTTYYSYSGGAHGNYGTVVQTVRLGKNPKLLMWEDVFLPSARTSKVLQQALEKSARERYQIAKDEPLTGIFFSDILEPTDNLGLTAKGILFVYSPYEIASYAVGEVQLFVPYTEVQSLLQPAYQTITMQ